MADPTPAPVATAIPQPTYQNELLVAVPYQEVVTRALQRLDFDVEVIETPTALGLTLMTVKNLAGRIGDAKALIPGPPDDDTPTDDLGHLLRGLRTKFADANQGWFPTMGRNRTVADNVIGGGSVSYGGDGDPIPLTGDALTETRQAWSERPPTPGDGVRIAIVDTKMFGAPQLAGGWYSRFSDTLVGPTDSPRAGHAAFVAGLILSVAPGATVEIRAALGEQGTAKSWEVAQAIAEIGGSGVDIINLSFSCLTADGQPPLALATAINVVSPQTVVVAAAGNHVRPNDHRSVEIDGRKFTDITRCVAFPAGLDNVIAVGATDDTGQPADYSPTGPWVDVLTPGHHVTSTFLADFSYSTHSKKPPAVFQGFASWSGTSFAAARVTGAIAARASERGISARAAWDQIRSELPSSPGRPHPHTADSAVGPKYLAPARRWVDRSSFAS